MIVTQHTHQYHHKTRRHNDRKVIIIKRIIRKRHVSIILNVIHLLNVDQDHHKAHLIANKVFMYVMFFFFFSLHFDSNLAMGIDFGMISNI